jgi:activator of 2-hydroxyglutaryl-CoA dehydratase
MRFLGLVASQGGLFHLPENTFLKKVLQKRLNTKIFISDKPEFCGAIGAG